MLGSASLLIAIAVILSALVSYIGTGARRQAVAEHRARASDLCELAGIFDTRDLQDMFGPPTLDGVFQSVTMTRIKQARTSAGTLMSDERIDAACIVIAALSMFISYPLMDLALLLSAGAQLAGWLCAFNLPKTR